MIAAAVDQRRIERGAAAAARLARRWRPVIGYTHDDALQDARIAVWRVLQRDAAAGDDLLRLAGYRRILDARTARWREIRGGARIDELDDAVETGMQAAPDAGPALVAARQACARIARLREPLPTVAAMLLEGYECVEIARRYGVSAARVSQWRARLQDEVMKQR